MLVLPKDDIPFVLDNETNAEQLICVLLQEQGDESLLPVGYFIRSVKDTERNHGTTERECLSIIWEVLMLMQYLEGARFTPNTDHDALMWLLDETNTSGNMARDGDSAYKDYRSPRNT